MILLEILVNGVWIYQFGMVIVNRFKHTGKVCSGDYSESELIMTDETG